MFSVSTRSWLFFIAVIVLLVVYAKKVDWEEVWKVIRDYNRVALLSAVGLVVVSYLIYGCYDLLARFYCGHKLAKRQVMLVSFICYAFNLTLSTWVGGIGMRYRLYSRLGCDLLIRVLPPCFQFLPDPAFPLSVVRGDQPAPDVACAPEASPPAPGSGVESGTPARF